MDDSLETFTRQLDGGRNYDSPPLHLWHPPLSGVIDIHINREGVWYHEGGEIKRDSMVRMFASILRREDDGEYYLVTPAEKWRISVESHPLIVVDVTRLDKDGEHRLEVRLNTGKTCLIGPEHPLLSDASVDGVAAVRLPHNLSAIFSRAAWYRLVQMAREEAGQLIVSSGGNDYILG